MPITRQQILRHLMRPPPTPSAWASNTKFTRRDKARFGGLFYFASSVSGKSGGGSGALPPHPPAGRFLLSSAQTKRPNSTQPFIPGSQSRSLTRAHLPFCSCGHPQELIVASVDPFFVFTFVCFVVQTHPSELVSPMHRHHATGQVEVFDALQPCFLHHILQLFLPRVHAYGFGEIAVT